MSAIVSLEVQDVSKAFGGVRAVNHLSCSFPTHTITGLIGPNGAGKTCLLDVISGTWRPDTGRVLINGEDVTSRPARYRRSLGLARVFQGVRTFGSLTVAENIRLAAKDAAGDSVEAAHALLARVVGDEDVVSLRDPVAQLPYAVQKTLPLAMAVAASPRTLLLDEPTVGFTSAMYGAVAAEIQAIARAGACVVLVEHNLDVVRDLADHVLFMAEGSLLREGSFDELAGDQELRGKYFGA